VEIGVCCCVGVQVQGNGKPEDQGDSARVVIDSEKRKEARGQGHRPKKAVAPERKENTKAALTKSKEAQRAPIKIDFRIL
jgi:hypothetical protein